MGIDLRQDYNLAPILKYENIAWFEDGKVKILDRRVYPAKKEFVYCNSYIEVALAIKDMVTQSAGPFTAGPMGMALAAYECRNEKESVQREFLNRAADTISNARPTTAKRMRVLLEECLKSADMALSEGKCVYDAIVDKTVAMNDERYLLIDKIAKHLVSKFPNGGKVMTYCWAETIVGIMLRNCREQNKEIKLFCCETRPYFQGARLTASCIKDMGFDVTVITDGMPSFVMANEAIDVFTTAADAICCDGSVINKVGTSNTAIVAKHYGVPYYVTGAPEPSHKTAKDVTIEMRDPEFTLTAMGTRTADEGVKGYYPSFDITSPDLVSGVVTPEGIFKPGELDKYFEAAGSEFRVVV